MPLDPITASALIGAGSSFLGGLFDDSGESEVEAAEKQAKKAYPGQKSLATLLAPYLWENLNIGLTEKEKGLYRGEGKTAILQGVKGARREASGIYASQGLRGGRVADVLSRINESAIPQFAGLETKIAGMDVEQRRKRITDILQFLSLDVGLSEGNDMSVSQILNGGTNTSSGGYNNWEGYYNA